MSELRNSFFFYFHFFHLVSELRKISYDVTIRLKSVFDVIIRNSVFQLGFLTRKFQIPSFLAISAINDTYLFFQIIIEITILIKMSLIFILCVGSEQGFHLSTNFYATNLFYQKYLA